MIQRSTHSLVRQPIAVRISGDPVAANNGIFYFHTDHLGSTSVMTKHSDGYIVTGSMARYTPFGDWRTEPSTDLTDRGFTGHMHNNTGSNDLGLIYMNARHYVPATARFASADTIVPDPMNPQSLNRYKYTQNNPLRLVDPTGHSCKDALEGYPAEQYDCHGEATTLEGEWPFNETNPLETLIGTEFEGAGTEELANAMFLLFHAPSDKDVENALIVIAYYRGLDLDEVRDQYATYYVLTIQADMIGRQNGEKPVSSTKDEGWWGSTNHLRFGKIVGDAFGIDAVFGALLSPTGGRVGPGDSVFLHWAYQNSEAVNYHGQVHDAGGYLYNYHNFGPGYTYAKPDAPESQRGNALMGQESGISLWKDLLVDKSE